MSWLKLSIQTATENVETVSALCQLLGAEAVTLQDTENKPASAILEPKLNTAPLWSQTEILALFSEKSDIDKIISFLKEQTFELNCHVELLEDQNWERVWLQHFKPMRFGKRLWVCPSTEELPDVSAVNIILDPGLAFGTGTHPTTALCLEWLDQNTVQNKTLIDYGCGSGILAIAALKLGAKEAWAVDYDPQALKTTLENAERNQIDLDLLRVVLPEQLPRITVDIIMANILANPLIQLMPRFYELINPSGRLVLSGLLENQTEEMIQAYQNRFKFIASVQREEWVRLEFLRFPKN